MCSCSGPAFSFFAVSPACRKAFRIAGSTVLWGGAVFMLTSTETVGRKFQLFFSIGRCPSGIIVPSVPSPDESPREPSPGMCWRRFKTGTNTNFVFVTSQTKPKSWTTLLYTRFAFQDGPVKTRLIANAVSLLSVRRFCPAK